MLKYSTSIDLYKHSFYFYIELLCSFRELLKAAGFLYIKKPILSPHFELKSNAAPSVSESAYIRKHRSCILIKSSLNKWFSAYKKRESSTTLFTRVAGFEPANDGIRIRCLTAWRYPIIPTNQLDLRPGLAGFEPANAGVKVLCLTAWR